MGPLWAIAPQLAWRRAGMNDNALFKNGILIRFPEERWQHILSEYPELAPYPSEVLTTVSEPEAILDGRKVLS